MVVGGQIDTATPVEETDRETERVRETEEKDRGRAREEKRK